MWVWEQSLLWRAVASCGPSKRFGVVGLEVGLAIFARLQILQHNVILCDNSKYRKNLL